MINYSTLLAYFALNNISYLLWHVDARKDSEEEVFVSDESEIDDSTTEDLLTENSENLLSLRQNGDLT